jgi:hypothetical protein
MKVNAKGEAMSDLSRGERLQIMLTEDELRALDDWRFTRRMPSRAAAVRELLKRGLAAEGIVVNGGRTKSQDFGVVTDGESKVVADGAGKKARSERSAVED